MTIEPTLLEAADRKPAFGAPCNGCGLCCLIEPCILAIEFLEAPAAARCPALEWEEGRFWCGLLRTPHRYIDGLQGKPWADEFLRETIMASGAFDVGCDSDDMPREEVEDIARQRA